ncbi:hypothetical protein PIB30_104901 [Stylosanthes scabra]|uniref:Uncharacterized protein n=1 Tax=Stylosanthes scabra TaxID=79078 RepID=A0ABU6U1F7_9FABA|nr:hypothetical protein [Stylosanthes scabra]
MILSENLRLIGFTDILAVLVTLVVFGTSRIGIFGSSCTGVIEGVVGLDAARASTKSFLGMSTEVGEGGRSESFNAASLGEARDGGILIFNHGDCGVKFGAEVAKKGQRNENIAKKSLEAKSRAYVYAPKEPMRTCCHDLGITSKLEPDHMHMHQRGLCIHTSGQICAYK